MSHLKISFVLAEEPVAIGQDGLDDPALLRHVRHHGEHVVIRGPDKGRAKDYGQVPELHLVYVRPLHDFLQMLADELQCLIILIRHVLNETFKTSQSALSLINLGHLDEVGVEVEREEWIRKLSKERLEQRRDDVDVVPTLVVELEMAFALVDLETVFATIRMGANCCYF